MAAVLAQFSAVECFAKRKQPRRGRLLGESAEITPWAVLVEAVAPH